MAGIARWAETQGIVGAVEDLNRWSPVLGSEQLGALMKLGVVKPWGAQGQPLAAETTVFSSPVTSRTGPREVVATYESRAKIGVQT